MPAKLPPQKASASSSAAAPETNSSSPAAAAMADSSGNRPVTAAVRRNQSCRCRRRRSDASSSAMSNRKIAVAPVARDWTAAWETGSAGVPETVWICMVIRWSGDRPWAVCCRTESGSEAKPADWAYAAAMPGARRVNTAAATDSWSRETPVLPSGHRTVNRTPGSLAKMRLSKSSAST